MKLNVVKMVAGNRWGGHPQTLLNVLNATVRSIMDYGPSIYGKAHVRELNRLTIMYNKELRICLRALK